MIIWYGKISGQGKSPVLFISLYTMKEYAAKFYKSKTWERCRADYIKSVGGLCERCRAAGRITAAVIVHHKIYITPDNINDPEITLSFNNLEALCRDCHGAEHSKPGRRWTVDETGKVRACS